MRNSTAAIISVLLLCLAASGCGGAGSRNSTERTVTVDAAQEFEEPMKEIAQAYEKNNTGVTIVLNTDTSDALEKQVEDADGKGVDLFLSGSTVQTGALNALGYVDYSNIRTILEDRIVLVTAKGSGTKVTGFSSIPRAKSLALAGSSVTVGARTRQIFDVLEIAEEVEEMKVTDCSDISGVIDAVADGSCEVGTICCSDYYSARDRLDLIETADPSWCDRITYPLALLNNQEADVDEKEAAVDVFNYLQKEEAGSVFEKYFFTLPEGEGK